MEYAMKKIFCLLTALLMLAGYACAESTAPADLLTDSVLEGKVVIEGVFYQMPFPVQQLLDNGWALDRTDLELEPGFHAGAPLYKDNLTCYVRAVNEYSVPKKFSECFVGAMEFGPGTNGNNGHDLIDVQFTKQISIHTSLKDVEKILGEPSSTAGGYPIWRGGNAKYSNPGHSFAAVFEKKLFSSELKYFSIEYMPADFVPAE